jgi:dsDNA-specific endonuclease/ATPase MutS2
MSAGCAPRASVATAAAASCRREGARDVRARGAPRASRASSRRGDTTTTRAGAREVSVDELRAQSLEACGWRELCEHLAEYASTRLGQEACLTTSLPTAGPWESELLLDETEAAMSMESHHGVSLDFGGVMSAEVRRALFKAEKFASLGGDELAAMMAFIGAATRLVKTVEGVKENGAPPPELQPLRDVVAGVVTHAEVAEKIRACVDDQGGFKDGASPELRRARSQRSTAEAKLRRALQSSSGSVTTHQGRFVLAVTPPAPAGSLVVGVAAGGGLVLIEPPGVVLLNGTLAQCIAAEETAIDAIRRRLTYDVAEVVVDLFRCLDVVTRLDAIAARGRHAAALNAVRPRFVAPPHLNGIYSYETVRPGNEEGGDEADADARQRAREAETNAMFPTLARAGAYGSTPVSTNRDDDDDDDDAEPDFEKKELLVELAGLRQPVLEAQAIRARRAARRAAARKLASKKKKRKDAGETENDADDSEYDALLLGNRAAGISPTDETSVKTTRGPVPVDVFVPLSTRCVVITGPNTGGKTAAMKAVGLAALMARAGLFIPAEIANVPWFDDVLVDIGDSQDLMQSLSTFSARLAKQRAILSAVTPRALVLMDEVGTGTSPAEGAAIGGALLERLAGVDGRGYGAGAAGLVLATTHHGELKALKYEHEGGVFENAAVEFDEVELAPTYRLLWGVPGRSRALQIAERFGFEPAIVADARDALGEGRVTLETTISGLETARRNADEDITAARLLLSEVRRTVPRIARAADAARAADDAADAKVAAAVARAKRARAAILRSAEREAMSAAARERRAQSMQSGKMDFAAAAAAAAAAEREKKRLAAEEAARPAAEAAAARAAEPGWVPGVGEDVVVSATGMAGKVTAVSGALVTVQAGAMGLKVNASDVIPDPNAAAKAKAARPPAKAFAPRGSRAARRVDALLGGGGRVAASSSSSSSSSSFGDYGGDGFGGDGFGGDLSPTLGDTVRIKKTGVVGVVVDVDGGVLSVQSGRNALKSPVEGVEFAPAGGGGGGGGGGKKKQKKQKKKGSGLPSGVAGSAAQKTSSSAPKPSPRGPADVNDLMAKFNRK